MIRANWLVFLNTEIKVFSKNHVSFFKFEGEEFYSVKMVICYFKVKFYNNEVIVNKILRTHHPADATHLAKLLVISDKSSWKKYKEHITPHIFICKFINVCNYEQRELRFYLKNTKYAILAMQDYSDFWGVKVSEMIPPRKWSGRNIMGRTIMDIWYYLFTLL